MSKSQGTSQDNNEKFDICSKRYARTLDVPKTRANY